MNNIMRNDLLASSIAFLSLALTVFGLVSVLILLRAPISLFLLFCFIIVAVPFINTVILFLILNRYKKKMDKYFSFFCTIKSFNSDFYTNLWGIYSAHGVE
jgi:hypothetical protein